MKIYLASTSPRRAVLLGRLGLSFEVIEPLFVEQATPRPARDEALYFAEQKALSVRELCPDSLVIAADTLIELDGLKIGKPSTPGQATAILKKLSGKRHQIFSAVVLLNTASGEIKTHLSESTVTFRELSQGEIRDYVASGEPIGKAGAYAIQGGAKKFIEKVEGDLDSIVGLPVYKIEEWLSNVISPD